MLSIGESRLFHSDGNYWGTLSIKSNFKQTSGAARWLIVKNTEEHLAWRNENFTGKI